VRFQRTRAAVERGRFRAEKGYERLQSARPQVPALDVAFDAYEHDRDAAGGILAGALAYRFFITLLPLMLVLVGGLGYLDAADDEAPRDFAGEFGISEAAASSVADSARVTSSGRLAAVIVGTVALVWAAFWAVRAVRLTHAIAWRLPERRWARNTGAALLYIGVVLAMAAVAIGDAWLREQLDTAGLLITIASTGIYFAIWLLVSWRLPRAEVGWSGLVPGALLVAVGIQVLHLATALYIAPRLDSATATYGALGVALVLLLWLYLLGRLVVASATLNATLWMRSARGSEQTVRPTGPRLRAPPDAR